MSQLAIVGLDSLQIHLPAEMLTVNVPHISHKEGIFLSRVADVSVDPVDTLIQYILRKVLSVFFAMVTAVTDAQFFFIEIN